MPALTLSDRMRELEMTVAGLDKEIRAAIRSIDEVNSKQKEFDKRFTEYRFTNEQELAALRHEIATIRSQHEKEMALLKETARLEFERAIALIRNEMVLLREKISQLESGREKFWTRLWMIVPPILAVILSAFITYFVKR